MKTNLEKAAPALLEALKMLCDVASTENLPKAVRDCAHEARAAIALAEAPDTDEKGWPYNRD